MHRRIGQETVVTAMIDAFVVTPARIAWATTFFPGLVWSVLDLLKSGPILSYAWLTTELPQRCAGGGIISLLNLCAASAGIMLQ